jgi:fatty-acyl-CoA synthase
MAISDRLRAAAALARTVGVPFERPDRLARGALNAAPWGIGVSGLFAVAAGRYPEANALVDDDGAITYREVWQRSGRLAATLRANGARRGTAVGVMCRNHRGFVVGAIAAARTGADLVLLNTGFPGPQLADVVAAENVSIVVHDDEFAPAVAECRGVVALDERASAAASSGRGDGLAPSRLPHREGRIIILTSGTTGRPKGAVRQSGTSGGAGGAGLLVRVPFRARDVQVVPAPFFHAWGLSHLMLGIARNATTVTSRRFDPAATLRMIERHRARVLAVVPVMLQRIVGLDQQLLASVDTSSLRIIATSGSALGGKLATQALEVFGPVVYNTYGSTEVAMASIADPDDLRRAPTTVGQVAPGVRVEILDADARPVPDGTVGRIFVGNDARFDGYTNGGTKEIQRGLMSSGDLGHFETVDGVRLLFVDGRDDDMVISGGENLFPGEVEDLLLHHPQIDDAAVVGVPDEEFGQVLAAFVVKAKRSTLTADAVRAYVRDNLARFKVPKRVEFVKEIPRNPPGKILRRDLANR